MKYSKLTIAGVPKSFEIWDVVDYVQPLQEDASPDEAQYDFYSLECDEEKGVEACVLFKYDESATGIFVTHTPHLQTLSIELSPWAVETGPSETCSISGYTDSGVTTTVRKNAVGDRVG